LINGHLRQESFIKNQYPRFEKVNAPVVETFLNQTKIYSLAKRRLLFVVGPSTDDEQNTHEKFKDDLLAKYELPCFELDNKRSQVIFKKKLNYLYQGLRPRALKPIFFDFYRYQTTINRLATKQRLTTIYTYYERRNLFKTLNVNQRPPVKSIIRKKLLFNLNFNQPTLKAGYIQQRLKLKKIGFQVGRWLTMSVNRRRKLNPLRQVVRWRTRRFRFFKRHYYRWSLFRHTAQYRWRVPAWRRTTIKRLFDRLPVRIGLRQPSSLGRRQSFKLKKSNLVGATRVSAADWHKLFNLFSTQPNRYRFNLQRVCFFQHKKTNYLRFLFSVLRLRYGTRLKARGATKIKIPARLSERRTQTNTRRWLKKIINQQPHRRLADRVQVGLTLYKQLQHLRQRHLQTTIQEIAFL